MPGWRDDRRFMEHVSPVEQDEMFFLLGSRAIRIPELVVPKGMNHHGDVTISLSRLTAFLAAKAEAAGVELYHGYSARTLLVEDGRVVGVSLGEVGLSAHGGEQVEPPAGGGDPGAGHDPRGRHARRPVASSCASASAAGRNPQVYSLGIKAVVAFAGRQPVRAPTA